MLEALQRVVVAHIDRFELFAHAGELRGILEEVEDQARKDLADGIARGLD